MTIVALALAWFAFAAMVSPRGAKLLGNVRPGLQAGVFLGAVLGLATIPASALFVVLSQALYATESSGSILFRCGRLIETVIRHPLARPEVTAALFLICAGAVSIAFGAIRALRSQGCARRVVRSQPGPLVVLPADELIAFTAGFLRPKVIASSALLTSAPEDWRRVVLAHEDAHRRGRHPLLLLLVESFARGLPIQPLRWGTNAFRLALEMVADESACRQLGSRELVAEAVAGIALTPANAGVGFDGDALRRVRRLLGSPRGQLSFGLLVAAGVIGVLGFVSVHAAHCGDAAFQTLRTEGCRVSLTAHSMHGH